MPTSVQEVKGKLLAIEWPGGTLKVIVLGHEAHLLAQALREAANRIDPK